MRYKKTIIGLLIALLPTLSFSAEEVRIDENRSVLVSLEEGWTLTPMESSPGLPARTIRITNSGSEMMVTLIASKDGAPIERSAQNLSDMATQTSMQYVSSSIEGKVNLKQISNEHVRGSYASFRDKQWEGKTPPVGEYACVTDGAFLVDGVMAAVTFFSSDLDGKIYKEGLSIIESLVGKTE